MSQDANRIEPGSFAEACVNDNTVGELWQALNSGPDPVDMKEWGLSEEEWAGQVFAAIRCLERDTAAHLQRISRELGDLARRIS